MASAEVTPCCSTPKMSSFVTYINLPIWFFFFKCLTAFWLHQVSQPPAKELGHRKQCCFQVRVELDTEGCAWLLKTDFARSSLQTQPLLFMLQITCPSWVWHNFQTALPMWHCSSFVQPQGCCLLMMLLRLNCLHMLLAWVYCRIMIFFSK